MNIKVNPTSVIAAMLGFVVAAIGTVTWTFAQNFVGTVYANDKTIIVHEMRFAGYDAMRPQIQEIMVKVGTLEKKIDDLLENSKKKGL